MKFSTFDLHKIIQTWSVGVAKSKVNNFNIALVVEKDVFRLDVPMGDSDLMQVLDSNKNLMKQFRGLIFV